MSDDIVIKVEGLSKLYMLGQTLQPYGTLRHAIQNAATAPLRWIKAARKHKAGPDSAEFWALKDVSFTVNRGDVVGILGRNGAGKSTLLKLIAGLEDSSEGDIYINGQLANYLRPKDRDVAMVFQNYALYPHMTVAENMGFSLRLAKAPKAEADARIRTAANMLDDDKTKIQAAAKELTEKLFGKRLVIYSEASTEAVSIRFRQQVNENSKELCWHHAIPEMNHNELVGWAGGSSDVAVVIFRHKEDHERTQMRMEINKAVFAKYTPHVHEVWSKGDTAFVEEAKATTYAGCVAAKS